MAGCMADIESDMSAIHRIEDAYSLPGPRFFRLAWRLAAYQGCMRDRQMAAAVAARGDGQPAAQPAPVEPAHRQPATRTLIQSNRDYQGIFSFGTGGLPGR